MGLKNSLVTFRRLYEAEKGNVPELSGVTGSNNIFTYTLREDEVGRQLAATAIKALKSYKSSVRTVDYSKWTSDPYCTEIAKEVLAGIRLRRRPTVFMNSGWLFNRAPAPLKKLTSFPKWKDFKGRPGVYVLGRTQGGRGVSIRFVTGASGTYDSAVRTLNQELRDVLWDAWMRESFLYAGKHQSVKSRVRSAGQYATRKTMQIAHDVDTTIGAMMLKSLKENNPDMVIAGTITTTEIVDQIEKNLGIDLDRNYEKTKNGFSFKWNITASLKFNQKGSEPTDRSRIVQARFKQGPTSPLNPIKVPGGGVDSGQAAVALIQLFEKNYGKVAMLNWVARGSKPPKQQAIEGHSAELIDGIVRPLTKAGRPDMRFKVNKGVKNFKKTKDSGVIKKPEKARAPKTKTLRVSQRVPGTLPRPQKEKRKGTQNISRLQALINKRLPAEVRRNMGRPALVNRSGTFSNSPEVVKIRQHPAKGLTADYTYMKTGGGTPPRSGQPGVYQTFENRGRWPAGYNPKDLIKKSIRNLALQYTEEKFVQLRRV